MYFVREKLTREAVLGLLQGAENSFTPPLSYNIPYSVGEYANRLSENALFILCKEEERIVGFTAFYINTEGGYAYIPQIWVSDEFQRHGIGSAMIDQLPKYVGKDIKSIRLEVRRNNSKAFSFYQKSGYCVLEEKNGRCLMEKQIVEG